MRSVGKPSVLPRIRSRTLAGCFIPLGWDEEGWDEATLMDYPTTSRCGSLHIVAVC